MARRPQKKEKRRVKRRQQLREKRSMQGGSPYRRIGQYGELKACYMTRDWKHKGLGTLFCVRRVPSGGHAMATFLIDFWCLGLKDAWGRLDIAMEEFHDMRGRLSDGGNELVRIDLDTARKLLAGSIQFARQNGFRLPAHYDRWVQLFGGLGDGVADTNSFGVDGKLRYVGELQDLRKRLLSGTAEEFLQRKDVDFVMAPDGVFELDDDDIELDDDDDEFDSDDIETPSEEEIVAEIRRWCFENGVAPHPRLAQAWPLLMYAAAASLTDFENGEEVAAKRTQERLEYLVSEFDDDERQEFYDAIGQIMWYYAHSSGLDDTMDGEQDSLPENCTTPREHILRISPPTADE